MVDLDRRQLLKLSAGAAGGVLLAAYLPASAQTTHAQVFINPFVQIRPDNRIIFYNARSEMGQGVTTLLAQYVLDELDADWGLIDDVRQAKLDFAVPQLTVGAISTFQGWRFFRQAGARLRLVFLAAGAEHFRVPVTDLTTDKSYVVNRRTQARVPYGALLTIAARLPLPESADVKDPSDFRYIGRSMPPLDVPDKVNGVARYGSDMGLEGMRTAVIARPPVFGGAAMSFDAEAALAVPGVEAVFAVPSGIAVVASNSWAALKGREQLSAEWDEGAFAAESSDGLMATLKTMRDAPGRVIGERGDAAAALEQGDVVEAAFEFPLVAHATMEPMTCTAHVGDDFCRIWAPTQNPATAAAAVAALLGRERDAIELETTLMGGGFGRRSQDDFVLEAVEVARRLDDPVKVFWTREDDMRHDYYRPMATSLLKATLDDEGRIDAWQHDLAALATEPHHFTIGGRTNGQGNLQAYFGAQDSNYTMPHFLARGSFLDTPMPVGILRGISHGYVNFAAEVLVDELAERAGLDPVAFRLRNMRQGSRGHAVVDQLGQLLGEDPAPAGTHTGIAYGYEGGNMGNYEYHNAVAAFVRTRPGGGARVEKIVAVFDHGYVVNPEGFRRQIEGGVMFALSMMFFDRITLDRGAILEGNFDSYQIARMPDTPEIEVHFIESDAWPMGVGEKLQGTVQPAIANALYRALGTRVRTIPVDAGYA